MKKYIVLVLLMTIGLSAQSQDKKNKNLKVVTEVNGNCEQCKKRIEKAAFAVSGVKMASWDISSHKLNVILNEEKSTIQDLKRAIAKVGHDTDEFKSTITDYENLHHCCKYERD